MQPIQNTAVLADHPALLPARPDLSDDCVVCGGPYAFGPSISPVCAVCTLAPTDTDEGLSEDVDIAALLRDACAYLDRHGWVQGSHYDMTATVFTPAACMVGAIAIVCYGGPVEAPADMFDEPGHHEFTHAVAWLDGVITHRWGLVAYNFNDTDTRTLTEVGTELLHAAKLWDWSTGGAA